MRLLLLGALSIGCGRIDFAPLSDAATGSDGSADASTADACLAAPCPPFATFCDNFETTPPDFSTWNDYQVVRWMGAGGVDPGSQAQLVASPSCGGRAVDARVVGDSQWTQLFAPLPASAVADSDGANLFAAPVATVYARAMMYLPSTNSAMDLDTVGFGDLQSQFILLNVDGSGTGSLTVSGGVTVSGSTAVGGIDRDRWHCVEVAATLAPDASGHMTVKVDGATLIDSAGVTQPNVAMPVDQFIIGISTSTTETQTMDAYFDDVAVAAQPIGCT